MNEKVENKDLIVEKILENISTDCQTTTCIPSTLPNNVNFNIVNNSGKLFIITWIFLFIILIFYTIPAVKRRILDVGDQKTFCFICTWFISAISSLFLILFYILFKNKYLIIHPNDSNNVQIVDIFKYSGFISIINSIIIACFIYYITVRNQKTSPIDIKFTKNQLFNDFAIVSIIVSLVLQFIMGTALPLLISPQSISDKCISILLSLVVLVIYSNSLLLYIIIKLLNKRAHTSVMGRDDNSIDSSYIDSY